MYYQSTDHPEHVYLAGAGILLGLIALLNSVYRRPLANLPGPWYTKWTDLVLQYKWISGQKVQYVHSLHQKYGSVVRVAPSEVSFSDVSAKLQIYTTKETFRKSPWYQRLTGPLVNNVFTTQDPDFHRRLRRLLSSPLSESSLKNVEPIIRSRVDLTIQRAGEEMKTRGVADMFKWSLFMTTDIIGELTFGKSFQMLEKGEKDQYIIDLEAVSRASSIRALFPGLVTFLQLYQVPTPFKIFNNAARAGRNMFIYAQQSLERYRVGVETDPDNVKPSLFTKMFKGEEEETLSFKEIRDSATSYLVAGSDTTSYTLTLLLWSVCKNPAIRDRLAKEVQELPADFTEHDAMQLPYLNHVVEETLRLYSAVPGAMPRVVPAEGATISGQFINGGMIVSSQPYSLHRNPDVFPRPEEFDPDRWANPTKAMKDSFFAFGGGARVCLGLHLARIELRLATALFFRTFPNSKVSTAEGMSDRDMEPESYFLSSLSGKRCLIEAC